MTKLINLCKTYEMWHGKTAQFVCKWFVPKAMKIYTHTQTCSTCINKFTWVTPCIYIAKYFWFFTFYFASVNNESVGAIQAGTTLLYPFGDKVEMWDSHSNQCDPIEFGTFMSNKLVWQYYYWCLVQLCNCSSLWVKCAKYKRF